MSDFLFAQPSILFGFAKAFDFFGTFDEYNVSSSPEEADARAITADFVEVGKDIKKAYEQVVAEANL